MEVVFFREPPLMQYLARSDKQRVIENIDRSANATEKTYEFQERISDLQETLERRERASSSPCCAADKRRGMDHSHQCHDACHAGHQHLADGAATTAPREIAIRILGAFQLAAIVFQLASKSALDFRTNMRERYRAQVRKFKRKTGSDPTRIEQVRYKILAAVDAELLYRLFSLAASILGQAHLQYWYSVHVLEFLVSTPARPVLVNVMNSVTRNGRALVLVLLLGIVIVYIFAIIAFINFQTLILAPDGSQVSSLCARVCLSIVLIVLCLVVHGHHSLFRCHCGSVPVER